MDTTSEWEVEENQFSEWLEEQLELRGWRPVDLANAAGLPNATISRILNGDRKAGPDVATSIARALNLSVDYVFRQAALLPAQANNGVDVSPTLQEIMDIVQNMPEEQQRQIRDLALFWLNRGRRNSEE